jgi:hypothetical protein
VTALGNNFGTSPGDNNIHALISDAYNDASLSAVTFSNNIIVASAPPDTIVACDGVIGPGAGTYVEFLAQGGLVSSSDGGVSFTESVIGTNPTVIARVYTISDVCGQSTTSTQLLTVIDSIAPVPDVDPLPLIAGQCSAFVSAAPTATDACTGTVIATTNDPLFYAAPGTYTIHWTYTDGNGISTTQPQTVIVQDTIPPLVTTHNLTVTLDAAGTASITPDQVVSSANDDC